jgi:hypothetical protein
MEIELRGKSVRVSVNGSEVNTASLDDPAADKYFERKPPQLKGRIGFQALKETARFRNIVLKDLTLPDDKKYESKTGQYLIAFPGKPDTTTTKIGDVEVHQAVVENGFLEFNVTYRDIPAVIRESIDPKEILAKAEKDFVDNFKASTTSSKDVEFGRQKLPARQIMAAKDATHLRLTIVLSQNRLYHVLVSGPHDLVAGKETDRFFESFEITE